MRDDIPAALAAIIERLVAKDPAHRFTSTHDLVAALEALPFQTDDHRLARETLRRLARGYRVPVVPTGVLPPLPDTRHSGAAAGGGHAPAKAGPGSRGRLLTLGIGAAAVVVVWGAWGGIRASASRTPSALAGVDSVAPVDSAAAPHRPAQPIATLGTRGGGIAARAEAAEPGGRGLVRLRTEPPDAVIYIDDREVGVGTVFDLEVPAGTRRLRIKAPGSVPLDTTFRVKAGNTTRLGLVALRSLP